MIYQITAGFPWLPFWSRSSLTSFLLSNFFYFLACFYVTRKWWWCLMYFFPLPRLLPTIQTRLSRSAFQLLQLIADSSNEKWRLFNGLDNGVKYLSRRNYWNKNKQTCHCDRSSIRYLVTLNMSISQSSAINRIILVWTVNSLTSFL